MQSQTRSGVWVPDDYGAGTQGRGPISEEMVPLPTGVGTVVNETGLPDGVVMEATKDYFVEHASMAWGHTNNFQMYSNSQGSLLARSEYRVPTNVIEEIKLARSLAERDDDVRAVMGAMLAFAYGEGMANFHEDERTLATFNAICQNLNMDGRLKEIYREYLIASQFTTVSLFTRADLDVTPAGGSRTQIQSVAAPLIGVLASENVRVIGNDMFGTAQLAYDPPDEKLRAWLDEYFGDKTSPARKAEMGRNDRISANMFTGVVGIDPLASPEDRPTTWGSDKLYLLNPRMCHRTTMPKGSWKYPRPLMTADFALLEAKRLLNIMDYALLQGGSNFIVVAKKGSDQRPAQPEEVENLREVVRRASRTGVIVGDHRLTFDIITPKLDELLNEKKRRLLGRKIAMAMLRVPEHGEQTAGTAGEALEAEVIPRVIGSDRQDIKRHIEGYIYEEVVKRNRRLLPKGRAKMWFPKIILQGTQYFTDLVLKLRDRGDIPRGWAVAAAGFDWDAAVQVRKGELARGDDEIMQPGSVPHSSPDAGPQDNNQGRPKGTGDGQTTLDPARPRRTITRTPGETVKAWYEESIGKVVRVGEITYAILEEFADTKKDGRVTEIEREAVQSEEPFQKGPVAVVPVNIGVRVGEELKAVRLREGLSMIVGERIEDGALMAKAICFREPEFSAREAEDNVARWGYPIALIPEKTGTDE